MTNFEAFRCNFSSSINLSFLKNDQRLLKRVRTFFHEFVCCCCEKTHKYDMHFMIVVKCMYVSTYNMPSYVTLCALETGQQIALLLVYLNQIFFVIFVFAENIG